MIYIIITVSIDNNYCNIIKQNNLSKSSNARNNRYINSITNLLKIVENDNDIKPIIVENGGVRETYLKRIIVLKLAL